LLIRSRRFDPAGRDGPCFGYSLVGLKRLDDVQASVEVVLRENVPGDLIETGVWRGGTVILMKGVLHRRGVVDRMVWAADSFEGLPSPTHEVDRQDASCDLSEFDYLKVSAEQVRENVARFGLLDDNVKFLKGWLADTLPTAPIDQPAGLRLDGDMYESIPDALGPLYPKLGPGGFVIVDDYHGWPGCRRAVDEYRSACGITAPLMPIDGQAVWWRKP
jgi:O-methyltransferase